MKCQSSAFTSFQKQKPAANQNNAVAELLRDSLGTLRLCLTPALRLRGGFGEDGPSHWATPGHQDCRNGYLFNRLLPQGQARKWEDWELPYYLTSFLTIVILGVGLNTKPNLTIETWAHQKALQHLQTQQLADNSE